MIKALRFLIDNIHIRIGNTLYRQVVGIQMVTCCAPLIADLVEELLKDHSIHDMLHEFNNTAVCRLIYGNF